MDTSSEFKSHTDRPDMALIRRAAYRTYDDLPKAVGHVCDLFTEAECYNSFNAAGNAPSEWTGPSRIGPL